ncbi:hypothetical protein BH09ACT12_BH09ACT12_27480 [soil metagenome]
MTQGQPLLALRAGASEPSQVVVIRTRTPLAGRLMLQPQRHTHPHRKVPGSLLVFTLGCLVGAVASVYAVRAGINLDYGDALAHLTIAQRISDSRSAGLSQLGTVWLPLPHLLLLPLVQSEWLFSTGVAACILGSLCLGASTTALYRIMVRLHLGRTAQVLGLLVFLANPAYLYLSTTALTEPVLIAALLMCIAGLAGWAFDKRSLSGGELAVFAGVPAALGALTRYEGWALVLSGGCFVVIVALRRGMRLRRAVALALAFAGPSIMAVGWWLAYNLSVYGTPTKFLTGEYSAAAYTQVFADTGRLTTAGNPGLSLQVLGEAMLENIGLAGLVVAGIGLLAMTAAWGIGDRALLVWLAGTSTAFLFVSLTTGQHIMTNDVSLPTGAYNNRYVLSALPWIALLCAVLVGLVRSRPRVATALVALGAVALVWQNVWWAQDPGTRISVIQEADIQHDAYREVKEVATWVGDHYDGGGILMDESALLVTPVIGIDHHAYVNRATGELFVQALLNPYPVVKWVFMHRDVDSQVENVSSIDRVTAALADSPTFLLHYRVVHESPDFLVFRRVDAPAG